jgi:signal recognition particle receptor subunit beta
MWDELAYGALGAVVMADTRRLADCFPSVDYFERSGLPFVVAVNCFDGVRRCPLDVVRRVTLAEHALLRNIRRQAVPTT